MRLRLEDLPALTRTTTFRLVAITAAAILLILMAALAGVYVFTIGQAQSDADQSAGREWRSLERVYAEGGITTLRTEVAERSERQTDMLYILIDVSGQTLYADFTPTPELSGEDEEVVTQAFQRRLPDGEIVEGNGRGRIGRLIGGPILVVLRDFGEAHRVYQSLMDGLTFVGLFGVIGAIGAGLIASQFAARRADSLSRTAQGVKHGDLAKRVPQNRQTPREGDEFDRLDTEINDMLDEVARLVLATRTAGDSIAHDLRSPLTRLKQNLDAVLRAAPGSDPEREGLHKAIGEVDKLLDTFNSILSVMRVDSFATSSFHEVDISALANELAEFFEPAAEEQQLAFRAHIAANVSCRGVREVLTQALANLIENAIKYTPPGGRVELRVHMRPDGRLEMAVLDDGPGIPEEDRERVRERFVRLEHSRTTQGSGLGLSLVNAVARLHRGVLSLADGLGDAAQPGLRAALILPVAP